MQDADSPPSSPQFSLVTALFFLSGAAGLVYQVLWMRHLGLFFGSDMYGVSIILATFMAGLALGSWLGGRLAERSARPLFWYGVAELGIGAFALGFAPLVEQLAPLLPLTYAEEAAAPPRLHQTLRVALAAGVLLAPTTLMGATLPLIMKHFVRVRERLGRLAAHFYAVNTLGALAGTLAGGFALLPYLGMRGATLSAAVLNLSIGAACCVLGFRAHVATSAPMTATALDPLPELDRATRLRYARAAIVALAVSGFASFALEVVWTRILTMSFSATVYSFASMLSCFLLGIFLGSRAVGSLVDTHPRPLALLAWLELGAGLAVGALCLLVNAVPEVFGRLLMAVAAMLGEARDHALVVSTLLASFTLLIVPTSLIGATFPVALRVYTRSVAQVGSRTGNLYAANTAGAILGSLIAGLWLVPSIGPRAGLALVAVLFSGIGAVLARVESGRTGWAASGVAGAALAAAVASLLLPYRTTLNFNQRAEVDTELLFHSEGVQSTVDVIRSPSGVTALVIGGNVEADDGEVQRRHFVLKGHLPLMLVEEPRSVLVVGLGMGITLQATARHPGIERIDVVELSPEIVRAQQALREVNGDILANPIVRVRIDDGRAFMELAEQRYDMITADPIHPKISRVGYLYTREYYQAIRERLTPGGIVCQWMPIYQIAPARLRSAVASFIDVFPESTLWYVDNHALLLGGLDSASVDFGRLRRRFEDPAVREDLASLGVDSPERLLAHLLMGPQELRAFVAADGTVPLNTDDFPYLEYFVPRDLFFRVDDNTRALAPHLSDPVRYVSGAPESSLQRIRAHAADREAWLLRLGDDG
jgi:spermidine synthase